MKVYVKKFNYDSCTGTIISITRTCGKGEISNFIIPALIDEKVSLANTVTDSNIVIDTLDVGIGRHATGLKTTTKLRLNSFEITVISEVYDDSVWILRESHIKNSLTATAKVIAKIVKNNIGDNAEIKVKVYQKDGEMVEYKDNTGL